MSNIKVNPMFQNKQFKRQLIQQRKNTQNVIFDNFIIKNRIRQNLFSSFIPPAGSTIESQNVVEKINLSNVDNQIANETINIANETINIVDENIVSNDTNKYNLAYIKNKIITDCSGFNNKM